MDNIKKSSHVGFRRQSLIFLMLNFFYSVFELGFNGVAARLPEGVYGSLWALLKIFFIITSPLMAVQLVVSRAVSSYGVLGEYGKRRSFVERTFSYSLRIAVILMLIGLFLSKYIAEFLRLDSALPVVFLFIAILFYFQIPLFYGVIQGLKKFYHLGFVQMLWGGSRFVLAAVIVFLISKDLNILLFGIIFATIFTAYVSRYFTMSIKNYPSEHIERNEILHAYGLVIPVIGTLICITVMKNVDVVFARRFFDPVAADAYACAALVGSAFFTLSGIFMVMFPMVSEENTRGGNPIIFLKKSFQIIIGLSLIGLVVAWFAPEFVMLVITLGKDIPGSEDLIRWIGFAVVPLSLVYIMSNYFLAQHQSWFLIIPICGMILQLLCIFFIHGSPLRMLGGIITANIATFICMIIYLIIEQRKYLKTSQLEHN